MEHVTVIDIGGGYYHLTPDNGYILYNKTTGTYHSDAETKNINEWTAVKK